MTVTRSHRARPGHRFSFAAALAGLGAALVIGCGAPTSAAAADFRLCNRSPHHIVDFQVERIRERGDYSPNWLRRPVDSGECVPMNFGHDEHACMIRHRIQLGNGEVLRGEVNICRVRVLEVHRDGRVTWE